MKKRALSFLLALVTVLLAVPFLAFSTTAEEADVLSVTWDESNPDCLDLITRNDVGEGLIRLYVWYDANDQLLPVDGWPADADPADKTEENKKELTVMDDGCYGRFNPRLYDEGILTPGMTWDEICEAYGAYLKECSRIAYSSGWSVGNMHNGVFTLVDSRCFVYSALLYGVRKNSGRTHPEGIPQIFPTASFGGGSQFCTQWDFSESFYADYIEKLKTAVQPDADGKIYWTDIAKDDLYLNTKVKGYTWEAGAGGMVVCSKTLAEGGTQYIYALRPDTHGPVALQYTVPEGVYGTATLDLGDALNFCHQDDIERFGKMAIALNGEIIWPAESTFRDTANWVAIEETTDLDALNETLADLPIDVKPGDTLQLCFTRKSKTDKFTVEVKPTIHIEKKYLVEYKRENGDVMQSTLVSPGATLPAAPMANAAGFYVNGDTTNVVTQLPATVTEHLSIQYVGEPKADDVTVEQVSITLNDDFSVNLYVKPDAYAVRVGAATDDMGEFWGEIQEDGLYKITLPGISVLDLDEDINLYLFQEFAGENNMANNADVYVLNPAAVLNTYVTDEAYAGVKDLAVAALDYMAAAHEYFEGESLGADVAARLATYDEMIAAIPKEVTVEDGYYDYSISGATLILKERVAIKIRVNLTEFDTLNDEILDFTVRVVDSMGQEQICEGFTYQAGAVYNGIPIAAVLTLNEMPVGDLCQSWQITVLDEDGEQISATVSYSGNAYIARTFEGGAGETDNLLRALCAYGSALNM